MQTQFLLTRCVVVSLSSSEKNSNKSASPVKDAELLPQSFKNELELIPEEDLDDDNEADEVTS